MISRCFLIVITTLAVFGCSKSGLEGPPEIKYGIDECAECGMIISDARYVAAIIGQLDGKTCALKFDDIGDALSYEKDHPNLVVTRRYVADSATRQWLVADHAQYTVSSDLHTPMGSGIAAYSGQNADRLSYAQLLARTDGPGK